MTMNAKTIRRLGTTFLGVLALNAAPMALAQDEFPAEPPAGSEPRDFTLPDAETYTLRASGVQVTLVPYGRVPKATIRAVVRAGNLNDGDKTWIADLTAAMMEEGAGGKSASELALEAATMGGDLNIGVGLDRTFAVMDVLAERAPDAMKLIADVIQRPNFPESELDRRRADLVRNVSIARTQAQAQASEAFAAILYPDHPYGDTLPDDGQLESYTMEAVKAFHAENFGGKRTHIYVVGQFDRRAVKRAIKSAFGKWESGPEPLVMPPEMNESPDVVLIDRPGAPQSTIRLGKRVPPLDGSVDLEAANTLLGGYFSSRITRNIREDKGYTYSPFSQVATRYKAANWQQNADVTSEATGPALGEILKEIRTLQAEAPGAAELEGIKNYMNGLFVIRLASRGGVANQLAFVDLHELGDDYLSSYVSKITALTGEDLVTAARDHLDIDAMSLAVVGPIDMVRDQLGALPAIADRLPKAPGMMDALEDAAGDATDRMMDEADRMKDTAKDAVMDKMKEQDPRN